MSKVLMIFIDGVGIGENDPIKNPFFKFGFNTFTSIFGRIPHLNDQQITISNGAVFPIDPLLDVPGIPLSGTGQTSIFCGINAPRFINQHFGPYPFSTLVPIIREQNIFAELMKDGKSVAFANAYPKIFFDYINSGRRRLSVTTLSCILSGVYLRKIKDLYQGNALSAEIDNRRFVERLNYKLPIIKAELAAKRLLRLSREHDFTLFEIFHTDHLGHGRNSEMLIPFHSLLDSFLQSIMQNLPKDTTFLLCSDHGNYEDLSIKMHTYNPSLAIAFGEGASYLSKRISNLTHIKQALLDLIN